jgi:hypothetical protein
MAWLEINKAGLAEVLERRGKSWALFELIQNAWDSGAHNVVVTIEPIPNSPFTTLTVEDDSETGWADLDDAFTMFNKSKSASDVKKRGRFCMGEKMVLALCRCATIETMQGTLTFMENGERRRSNSAKRHIGTRFTCEIRMTRDEMDELIDAAQHLIPPTHTIVNGEVLTTRVPVKQFEVKLPTEISDGEGLRRTVRLTTVEVYQSSDGQGQILEMGIPVCSADFPWRLNVMQKVPLGMERDSVTESFRKSLQVAAMNAMASSLSSEEACQPWATEAISDARIQRDALDTTIKARFGDRAVVAVPGDPMANSLAEQMGCTVIHGGSLPGAAWANIRKNELLTTTSLAFPSPKPNAVAVQVIGMEELVKALMAIRNVANDSSSEDAQKCGNIADGILSQMNV